MNILANLRQRLDRVGCFAEMDVPAADLPSSASALDDAAVLEVMRELAAISNDVARMQSVIAGVAAQRSRREAGHEGLAASQGHSSPASLVQSIMGGRLVDAKRQLRVGEALLEESVGGTSGGAADGSGEGDSGSGDDGAGTGDEPAAPPRPPWHDPLRHALLDGRLTTDQHDAIRTGLGDPIVDGVDVEVAEAAWSAAARSLMDEVGRGVRRPEDLGSRARAIRDALDPTGAEERFAKRYENRSLRRWVDEHGQHHAHLVLDDQMAEWIESIMSASMRPRRGGPRFMTDDERARAKDLSNDPRTNAQLEYDLFTSLIRSGALADAEDVFGARQPGVRLVVMKDAVGPRDALNRLIATGFTEDGGHPVPGSVIDSALCDTGSTVVTIDACGNPLDVGREQRLFGAKQRLSLAVRDGGCMWPGCDQRPSYCEAHHIDPFSEGGRTDIDRGILLCRFHHLLLHNGGYRIVRDGQGPFRLIPPDGGPEIVLTSKAAWKWAWDPPPPPERRSWRAA